MGEEGSCHSNGTKGSFYSLESCYSELLEEEVSVGDTSYVEEVVDDDASLYTEITVNSFDTGIYTEITVSDSGGEHMELKELEMMISDESNAVAYAAGLKPDLVEQLQMQKERLMQEEAVIRYRLEEMEKRKKQVEQFEETEIMQDKQQNKYPLQTDTCGKGEKEKNVTECENGTNEEDGKKRRKFKVKILRRKIKKKRRRKKKQREEPEEKKEPESKEGKDDVKKLLQVEGSIRSISRESVVRKMFSRWVDNTITKSKSRRFSAGKS